VKTKALTNLDYFSDPICKADKQFFI